MKGERGKKKGKVQLTYHKREKKKGGKKKKKRPSSPRSVFKRVPGWRVTRLCKEGKKEKNFHCHVRGKGSDEEGCWYDRGRKKGEKEGERGKKRSSHTIISIARRG